MKKKYLITSSIASALIFGASSALAAVDSAAEKVELRQSCTVSGATLDNCFTNFQTLASWMSSTRRPNETIPLHVNIGPGTFLGTPNPDINIICNPTNGYTGYTTFQGSGNNQTTLKGTGSGSTASINIQNCTELGFSDIKIATNFYGGIYWKGGGNSRWTNIDIDTIARAWAEPTCGAKRGNHYWLNSKLNSTAAFSLGTTYQASCDESWFFGSEVTVTAPDGGTPTNGAAVAADGSGIIHLYGSVLRALIDGPISSSSSLSAAAVGPLFSSDTRVGGEIHIHGTGIDVISETGQDAVVFSAAGNGMIHADASAYNMSTTGNKTRIKNNGGMVKAPYQWVQNNQPPQVISENGADMFVETNCDANACHDVDTGTETHLLIYNESCDFSNHGPWFDIVTRKCRGDMSTI